MLILAFWSPDCFRRKAEARGRRLQRPLGARTGNSGLVRLIRSFAGKQTSGTANLGTPSSQGSEPVAKGGPPPLGLHIVMDEDADVKPATWYEKGRNCPGADIGAKPRLMVEAPDASMSPRMRTPTPLDLIVSLWSHCVCATYRRRRQYPIQPRRRSSIRSKARRGSKRKRTRWAPELSRTARNIRLARRIGAGRPST